MDNPITRDMTASRATELARDANEQLRRSKDSTLAKGEQFKAWRRYRQLSAEAAAVRRGRHHAAGLVSEGSGEIDYGESAQD
jgi:hypothetical protein